MPVLYPVLFFHLEVGFVCETVVPFSGVPTSSLLPYFLLAIVPELLEMDGAVNLPCKS